MARIHEAQVQVAQSVPAMGLAVAIDIGEESIRPLNKQDVGKRLALKALHKTYSRETPCDGPVYRGMTTEGNASNSSADGSSSDAHGDAAVLA